MNKPFFKKSLCYLFVSAFILSSCNNKSDNSTDSSENVELSKEMIISSDIESEQIETEDVTDDIYSSSEENSELSHDDSSTNESEFSIDAYSSDDTDTSSITSEEISFDDLTSEDDTSENTSFEEISEDSSEDLSEEEHKGFIEPEGKTYTTENGNTFETNCTDEDALSIMFQIADTASNYNKATVYYTDVNQKYYFAFGDNNIHNTASTIKAPYATYLLKSGADLSEVLVMEKRHVFTGSGVLKNEPIGSKYSVGDLIRYMITRSDNTAYAMLLERFGTKGFREYSQSLGLDFKLPSGGSTTCTIREMATFLLDIYQYRETERGKLLIKHMKNCSYSLQIPKAVKHEVAHKFGFIYEGKAFHDMGIVYAPTPYIELIFTKIDGTVYDTKAFLELGKLVENLNKTLSDKY